VPVLAAGLALAAAVPALAHTELVSTTPKTGSSVAHLPKTIVMTFTEAPLKVISVKVLRGTTAASRVTGHLNPKNARQILVPMKTGKAGKYTVKTQLIAPDGDKQLVTFGFRVTG
jgi:methionine-rich copper-binding protein CopC